LKGQGRRRRHREVVRSSPEEGWVLPTKLSQCLTCWGGFTRSAGVDSVPEVALPDSSGDGKCLGSQGFRRVIGSKVWAVRSLEGQRPKRVAATKVRACSSQCERTRGGRKASKQVKPAVRTILPLVTQGNREASLRTREKGTHSSWGIQATASKAWESVKPRVIRSLAVRSEEWWITARELVASREDHDLREGKTLKGGSLGTVAA